MYQQDFQQGSQLNDPFQQMQVEIPNSTAVLVLGILSIPFCCCYGFAGLIPSIIALVLASNGMKTYNANQSKYTEKSLKNLKAGKTCALIGLIISIIGVIFSIIYFIMLATGTYYELMDEFLRAID